MKYLAYYDTPENKAENRSYQLSAANKVDYICSVLSNLGQRVQIVSPSVTANRKGCRGKVVSLSGTISLKLFPCLGTGSLPKRILRRILLRLQLLWELVLHTQKGENVLVYHSLAYAGTIALAKKIRNFRLILEVEEVYADVSGNEKDRKWECRLFDLADAFLFPAQSLSDRVNTHCKPYALIHGTYQVEADRDCRLFRDGKVHCVYAGTFDPRKGGALAAAAAAEFLPENYHMHLLGFGSDEEVRNIRVLAETLAAKCACEISYDGLLSGEEYVRFLQSCDIGLSTQNPEAAFNATSFPSKILSYMANGLRVVSIRIPVVTESAVGDWVHYYDRQTPEEIAKAIRSTCGNREEDPRERIEALNRDFEQKMQELIKHG